MARPVIPIQVGPCHFEPLGKLISVRCPREFAAMMRQHGGEWDPGCKRWLIERRRIGPVLRALRRTTDPLFRQAGVSLDEG